MLSSDFVEEYSANHAGKMFGMFASVVKDVSDPKQIGRVKVYCPKLYGEDLSPWAYPCFPSAIGIDTGSIDIPPLDSYVWITFEEGDPSAPIYMGGFAMLSQKGHHSDGGSVEELEAVQNNQNPFPLHAQGLPDSSDLDGVLRDTDRIPASPFRGEYGKVQVRRTSSGHVFEFDNTESAERIFLRHGPTGAYYEMQPNGSVVEVSVGPRYSSMRGDNKINLGAQRHSVVGKTEDIFGGAYSANYISRYSASFQGSTVDFDGDGLVSKILGQISLSASSASLSTNGPFEIFAGDSFNVSGSGANILSSGDGSFVTLNVFDPTGLSSGLNLEAMNGVSSFKASDKAGATSSGIECWNAGVPGVSNQVVLGNITGPAALRQASPVIPLVKEGVVMGTQLQLALTALIALFQTYAATLSSGGVTPGYGSPNPVLASANVALASGLTAWATTYSTPAPPRGQPVYASDTVFVSK